MRIPKTKNKRKLMQWAIKTLDTKLSLMVRARDKDLPCIDLCGTEDIRQCGHFRQRSCMSTRFHPANINSQNKNCNYYKSSKNDEYMHGIGIDKKYGKGKAAELCKLSKQIKQWTFPQLLTLITCLEETPDEYAETYYKLTKQ